MTSSTARERQRPPEPKLDRSLTLHLRGDWGTQHFHRVCGWISQELRDRAGPFTRIAIWNSRGGVDAVRAVGRGEVDIAITTPVSLVPCALDGRGPFAGEAFPHLRALGVIPQRDRMVVGIRRDLGISSFAQLREEKPALTVATGVNDGVSLIGWVGHEILRRSRVDVVGWGGTFLEDERPFEAFDHVIAGRANAIVQEALMLPPWQQIAGDLTFLPIEQDVLDGFRDDLGLSSATVPAGYLADTPEIRSLEFADFMVLTSANLPDDVAYAVAWILGETSDTLLQQYRYPDLYAAEYSPITYPLDPVAIGRSPLPLHPAAAGYFDALPDGAVPATTQS